MGRKTGRFDRSSDGGLGSKVSVARRMVEQVVEAVRGWCWWQGLERVMGGGGVKVGLTQDGSGRAGW